MAWIIKKSGVKKKKYPEPFVVSLASIDIVIGIYPRAWVLLQLASYAGSPRVSPSPR